MKKYIVEVNQELVNYIERLSYEEASYKDVIMTMLEAHKGDVDGTVVDNPVFKSYQEKYSQVKAEYEMAKAQVTEEYVPDCFKEHRVEWSLDFNTNELTVSVLCDCGEKILEDYLCQRN